MPVSSMINSSLLLRAQVGYPQIGAFSHCKWPKLSQTCTCGWQIKLRSYGWCSVVVAEVQVGCLSASLMALNVSGM